MSCICITCVVDNIAAGSLRKVTAVIVKSLLTEKQQIQNASRSPVSVGEGVNALELVMRQRDFD